MLVQMRWSALCLVCLLLATPVVYGKTALKVIMCFPDAESELCRPACASPYNSRMNLLTTTLLSSFDLFH